MSAIAKPLAILVLGFCLSLPGYGQAADGSQDEPPQVDDREEDKGDEELDEGSDATPSVDGVDTEDQETDEAADDPSENKTGDGSVDQENKEDVEEEKDDIEEEEKEDVEEEKAGEDAEKENGETSNESPWTASMRANHFHPLVKGASAFASFGLNLGWRRADSQSLNISLAVDKPYEKSSGEDELTLHDLALAGVWTPGWQLSAYAITPSVSITLPISRQSRINETYTRISLRLAASRSFQEAWTHSVSTGSTYHVNRYKTAAAEDGGSGAPLPLVRGDLGTGITYTIGKTMNLSFSASISAVQYEDSNRTTDEDVTDFPYGVGATVSDQFLDKLSVSAGYSHGDRLDAYRDVHILIFDQAGSTLFVSLGYTY